MTCRASPAGSTRACRPAGQGRRPRQGWRPRQARGHRPAGQSRSHRAAVVVWIRVAMAGRDDSLIFGMDSDARGSAPSPVKSEASDPRFAPQRRAGRRVEGLACDARLGARQARRAHAGRRASTGHRGCKVRVLGREPRGRAGAIFGGEGRVRGLGH